MLVWRISFLEFKSLEFFKSTLIFLDACYTGFSREKETLLASARPVRIVAEDQNNIPEDEQDDELSLYNFKLAGLISGKDYSYISLVNTAGEVMTITLGQYLGKIQLVDLRLNEAIFKKENESFIIIDFNNQIREANEY